MKPKKPVLFHFVAANWVALVIVLFVVLLLGVWMYFEWRLKELR